MQLLPLKNQFVAALEQQYGANEAAQFFYMLAEESLGFSKTEIALQPNFILSAQKQDYFKQAQERLQNWEPIQHIIGKAYFFGNEFLVNEHTLIPRPETEELIEWIANNSKNESTSVLDIGTGTGCIAISLAQQLLNAQISAMDISAEALKKAQQNAAKLNAKVNFIQQNVLELKEFNEFYDVVVSNPPYVRESEKALMKANVLDFEPETALFVEDSDPLIFYRKIAELFLAKAKKTSQLYFEINEYLAQELSELLYNLGFTTVEVKKDFRGKDRMLKATLNQ